MSMDVISKATFKNNTFVDNDGNHRSLFLDFNPLGVLVIGLTKVSF